MAEQFFVSVTKPFSIFFKTFLTSLASLQFGQPTTKPKIADPELD
jgi:hypothetical protein